MRAYCVLVLAVAGSACSAPLGSGSSGGEDPPYTPTADVFYRDPVTGEMTRSCPDGPLTVTMDPAEVSDDGLLTVSGVAQLPDGRWTGFARFERAFDDSGTDGPTPLPFGRAYPATAPVPPPGAVALGSELYLDGRFTIRAPADEVLADTVGVAYGCGDPWRMAVRDLIADGASE